MTLSFARKKDLNTVGSGNYIFRRYGCESVSYYELDWIASTGSQWIRPGLFETDFAKVETEIIPWNVNSTWQSIIYSEVSASPYNGNGIRINTSNKFSFGYGGNSGNYTSSITASNNTSYTIVLDGPAKKVTINGTTYNTSFDANFASEEVAIFANGANLNAATPAVGQYGYLRMKYMRIYDNSYNLIRDYIPVMRVSDLEVGLLDRLTGTFYINQGTGSFIPGIKVSGYSQLDYLYGKGSVSNINTGVEGGTSAKYDTCIKVATVSNAWARYMGGGDLPPYPVVVSNQGGTGAKSVTVSSYLNSKTTNYVTFTASNVWHNLSVDGGNLYWDNSLSTSSAINEGWSTPAFRMFTTNWIGGGGQSYQVYYKMWSDNELVRYYIPVRRASDNAIGMYDLVGRQFYANDGSTAFTYGVITLANTGTDANIITYKNEEIITPDKPQTVASYTNLESNYCTVSYEGTTYTGTGTFTCTPGDTVSVYVRSFRNPGSSGQGSCDSTLYLHKVDGTTELLDSKTASTAGTSTATATINYNYVIPERHNVEFRKMSSGISSRIDIYETEF